MIVANGNAHVQHWVEQPWDMVRIPPDLHPEGHARQLKEKPNVEH